MKSKVSLPVELMGQFLEHQLGPEPVQLLCIQQLLMSKMIVWTPLQLAQGSVHLNVKLRVLDLVLIWRSITLTMLNQESELKMSIFL